MRLALAILISAAFVAPAAAAPRLDLSRLRSAYVGEQPPREAGVARTAVERRIGDRGASAGFGFLCGRQPSAVTKGAAAAYGVDPEGRFLGAQLRFGFR